MALFLDITCYCIYLELIFLTRKESSTNRRKVHDEKKKTNNETVKVAICGEDAHCPNCGEILRDSSVYSHVFWHPQEYCPKCGKHLDWGLTRNKEKGTE